MLLINHTIPWWNASNMYAITNVLSVTRKLWLVSISSDVFVHVVGLLRTMLLFILSLIQCLLSGL